MATITASAAGGKASAKTAWVGEVLPTAADDVVLAATSGSIEIAAATTLECRSIDGTNYKKTLSGTGKLKVGTTTSNAGLCLKWGGAEAVWSYAGTIEFVSTSGTVEKITFPAEIKGNFWTVNGAGGKWELQSAVTKVGEVTVSGGELKTGNQNVECTTWWTTAPGITNFGTSTLTCTRSTATVFNSYSAGIQALNMTLKITGAAGTKEIVGAGNEFGVVIVESDGLTISGANHYENLEILTRGKSATGTKFTANTQTITGSFVTNGVNGEPVKLLASVKGKTWKLKKTSGTVEASYLELEDNTAEGGARWIDRGVGGLNKGNNFGWQFDEQVVFNALVVPPTFMTPSGRNQALIEPFPPLTPLAVTGPQTVTEEPTATQEQSASLERQITRTLSASQPQSATKAVTLARTLTASQGQAASKAISATTTLSATQGQSVVRVVTVSRAFSATQVSSLTLSKTVGRTLSITQGQSVTRAEALARTLSASQGSSATHAEATSTTLAAAQGQSVVLVRTVGRILSASQAQSATKSISLSRTLTASQGQSVVKAESLTRTLSVSQASSASQATSRTRTLAVSQGQSAAKSVVIARTLSAGQGQAASRSVALTRTLRISQPQEAALTARIGTGEVLLSVEQGQSASVSPTTTRPVALTAAQGQSVTMRRSVARTLASTQTASASLARSLTRHLALAQPQEASLRRTLRRSLPLVSQGSTAALRKDIGKVLVTVPVSSVIVVPEVGRILEVGQGQSVTLTARVAFYPGTLSSQMSWPGVASDTATGVSSSTSSAIVSSNAETSIASSVEPVVNVESGVE